MFTTPRSSARTLRFALPLTIGALVLAGCSGDGATTDDGTAAAGAAATGTTATDAGGAGTGDVRVAAVIKGLDNPFFQAMEQGLVETGGDAVEVQAAADIADTAGQADRLAALAGQDFDCFVVNPISGNNLAQALAQVSAAGTPVVNIDSPVDAAAAEAAGVDIATYIGTDNEAAGGKAGEFLVEQLPEGAQVAVIGGIAGDVTSAARIDGFRAATEGTLEVVQEQAADWQREVALTAATDILAANPEVAAFFAANDDMGLGIQRAVENAGRTDDVLVVSVDGNSDALQSVADGALDATVAQYPFAIGALGFQACQAAAGGAELPAEVESPTALVTADVAQQALDAFPQPFEEFENPLDALTAGQLMATATAHEAGPDTDADQRSSGPLASLKEIGFWAENAAPIGLVALVVLFSFLSPTFLTLGNIRAMLVAGAILVILAVAQAFVITTGGIDLSISATMTVGAVALGLAWAGGLGFVVSVVVAVLAATLVGLVNGLLIAKGKVTDFIVTLGTLSAATGLALILSDGRPIAVASPELLRLTSGAVGPIGYPVLIAVVVAVVGWFVMFRTRFGLRVQAVGGNEESAVANGIDAARIRIAVYVIAGTLAGLAALLLVARVGAAEPTVNTQFLLNSIAAVVLGGVSLTGGKAKIVGPVLGALLLTALTNGLTLLGVSQFYQPLAVGVVVILAALLTRYQKR